VRKEYNNIESSTNLIESIVDLLLHTGIYDVVVATKKKEYTPTEIFTIRDSYTYAVVKNTRLNMYVIFFTTGNKYIHMIASTEYDDSKDIFYQQGIIVNDTIKSAESGILTEPTKIQKNQYFIFPSLSMYDVTRLVCNYEKEDGMVLLSGIRTKPIEYEWGTDKYVNTITYNMCFGGLKRNSKQQATFLMGGDFCLTIELIHRSMFNRAANNYIYMYSYINILPSALEDSIKYHFKLLDGYIQHDIQREWVDYPFEDENIRHFTKILEGRNTLHKFNWFLRTDIDEYGYRDNTRWLLGEEKSKVVLDGDYDKETSQLPNIRVLPIWATTLNMKHYIPLVASNSLEEGTLPTYKYLMSRKQEERGRNVNTLNSISLILPIYFYVKRDPNELNIYSLYGYSDVVNYVNMYNMFTDTMKESNYPIDKAIYNCFQTGRRRQAYGDVGYNGIAFKQEMG